MSEREALARFHDWRAARGRQAASRRQWRSRCIGLVAVLMSIGLAALLATGISSFGTWRLTAAAELSAPAVDLTHY